MKIGDNIYVITGPDGILARRYNGELRTFEFRVEAEDACARLIVAGDKHLSVTPCMLIGERELLEGRAEIEEVRDVLQIVQDSPDWSRTPETVRGAIVGSFNVLTALRARIAGQDAGSRQG
jgi:hypothetical protein